MTGFDAALIQKKGNIRSYLDAAWAAQLIRGLLLSLVLFLTAPLVAAFFQEPRAIVILQVLALSELIKGFQNIGIVYFHKDFEFHKEFAYRFSNTAVKLAVSIPAALLLRDALALVIGIVVADLVSCVMSYALHPYRPRLGFDWEKLKELFRYGKWILGTALLTFLCNQGDDVFLGKMLGANALGLYQMAYLISNLPATEITHVASRVSFPAYSRLQDDLGRLREMHLAVLRLVAAVSMPLAAGIFFLSPDFTKLFLGPRWEPMVTAMQLLVLWGLMRSVGAPIGALLQGYGRPHVLTRLQFVKLILLIIFIYPMTMRWGMMGTALAVVVHTLPIEVFVHSYAIRMLECSAADYLKSLYLPLLASLVMLASLAAFRAYVFPSTSVVAFGSSILVGLVSYSCVMAAFEFGLGLGLRQVASRLRSAT
jgi:O-antigen/teichoic acid export membrane protein